MSTNERRAVRYAAHLRHDEEATASFWQIMPRGDVRSNLPSARDASPYFIMGKRISVDGIELSAQSTQMIE